MVGVKFGTTVRAHGLNRLPLREHDLARYVVANRHQFEGHRMQNASGAEFSIPSPAHVGRTLAGFPAMLRTSASFVSTRSVRESDHVATCNAAKCDSANLAAKQRRNLCDNFVRTIVFKSNCDHSSSRIMSPRRGVAVDAPSDGIRTWIDNPQWVASMRRRWPIRP